MSKFRTIGGIALTVALCAICSAANAVESISYAYLRDPAQEALVYAIRAGKVQSSKISVDLKALTVPALTQATMTKQFDVVQTSALAVPDAASRGLDLKIIGIGQRLVPGGRGMALWTNTDSPIKSVTDLRGKSLGVTGVKSMGTSMIRLALWKRHGFDVALSGGDVRWVEMPSPNLPSALLQHRIDATNLIPTQAFQVRSDKNLRVFDDLSGDLKSLIGPDVIYSVLVAYPDRLQEHPDDYREFVRLLKASVDYALSHQDEVFSAVSAQTNMPVAYFKEWFEHYINFPVVIAASDGAELQKTWEYCKLLGVVASYPNSESVLWNAK
jgi:NitT/TauT family transport system substrate-binding protein